MRHPGAGLHPLDRGRGQVGLGSQRVRQAGEPGSVPMYGAGKYLAACWSALLGAWPAKPCEKASQHAAKFTTRLHKFIVLVALASPAVSNCS